LARWSFSSYAAIFPYGFLKTPDFRLGIFELLLSLVNQAEDRFEEKNVQDEDQQEEIDDLDSQGIIKTDHCPSPQMRSIMQKAGCNGKYYSGRLHPKLY